MGLLVYFMLLTVPKNLFKFDKPMGCTKNALIFFRFWAKTSINIPTGIVVNSFILFRPDMESGTKNPVLDKLEPESNLKFPVSAM